MHPVTGAVCAVVGLLAGPRLAILPARFPPRGEAAVPQLLARPHPVAVAAVVAVVAGLLGWRLGWRAELPAYVVLGALGVVLAVTDLASHRLPDVLVAATYVVGVASFVVAAVVRSDGAALGRSLLAALTVFAVAAALTVAGGIGFGDAKLLGTLGLHLGFLGWTTLSRGLALGFVLGALVALALILTRRASWRSRFALGPELVAGCLAAVVLA